VFRTSIRGQPILPGAGLDQLVPVGNDESWVRSPGIIIGGYCSLTTWSISARPSNRYCSIGGILFDDLRHQAQITIIIMEYSKAKNDAPGSTSLTTSKPWFRSSPLPHPVITHGLRLPVLLWLRVSKSSSRHRAISFIIPPAIVVRQSQHSPNQLVLAGDGGSGLSSMAPFVWQHRGRGKRTSKYKWRKWIDPGMRDPPRWPTRIADQGGKDPPKQNRQMATKRFASVLLFLPPSTTDGHGRIRIEPDVDQQEMLSNLGPVLVVEAAHFSPMTSGKGMFRRLSVWVFRQWSLTALSNAYFRYRIFFLNFIGIVIGWE
jgi:hypothetical protein